MEGNSTFSLCKHWSVNSVGEPPKWILCSSQFKTIIISIIVIWWQTWSVCTTVGECDWWWCSAGNLRKFSVTIENSQWSYSQCCALYFSSMVRIKNRFIWVEQELTEIYLQVVTAGLFSDFTTIFQSVTTAGASFVRRASNATATSVSSLLNIF